MKPKKLTVDRFALRRDKEMSPAGRLDWLAAARGLIAMPRRKAKKR